MALPAEGPIAPDAPLRFAGEIALGEGAAEALDAVAAALVRRGALRRVRVVLHAEAPGDRRAVRLARRRAEAVADYLRAHGVSARITGRGVAGDPPGALRVEAEGGGGGRSHRRHRH